MPNVPLYCRCGHDLDAHEHFRAGRDCGACGAGGCAAFRARSGGSRPTPARLVQPSVVLGGGAWIRLRGGRF
jgi:hypothetical protein